MKKKNKVEKLAESGSTAYPFNSTYQAPIEYNMKELKRALRSSRLSDTKYKCEVQGDWYRIRTDNMNGFSFRKLPSSSLTAYASKIHVHSEPTQRVID